MIASTCFLSKNNENVENFIQHINSQFDESRGTHFQIDENIARLARQVFRSNYRENWCVSKTSLFLGIVGVIGLGAVIVTAFYSHPYALCAMAVSAACIVLFINLRNREGYRLQKVLDSESEAEKIRQLSLGANIYQSIYPFGGGAAPALLQILKRCEKTTIHEWLARTGERKTLAYALILEEDLAKRTELATRAISKSKNIETARLLLYFGARIDGSIENYEQWQADIDYRTRHPNWFSSNSDGVSRTLNRGFKTPLERLTIPDKGVDGEIQTPSTENPQLAFEALGIDSSVYTGKDTAENLFHALNKSGARIRLEYAKKIFSKLNT